MFPVHNGEHEYIFCNKTLRFIMKRYSLRNFTAAIAFCSALIFSFVSCADFSDSASDSVNTSVQYGSITVTSGNASRALDVSTLNSATVTVSGYDMTDKTSPKVTISGGVGNATISDIPVGKNRVVTVKSNVDGVVIRAVCDVNPGKNENVIVNWNTTAKGNIFYYLIAQGTDVSDISPSSFDSVIDSSVHPTLIDAQKIAKAYPNFGDASSYVSTFGTVKVTASNANGYTVQVTDIATESKTISSANESFNLKAYPGAWKVWVLKDGEKVAEKDITVVSGETSTVDLSYSTGGAYDFSGKTIAFVKANSAPTIWAWEDGGVALSEAGLGGKWSQSSEATLMTAADSAYMQDISNWYMMDYTSCATGKTVKFKLNFGGNEITGAAGTFWYDSTVGGDSTTTNPSPVVNSEGTLSLAVNSAKEPGKPVKIYVSAKKAPTIWAWQPSGLDSMKLMGYDWNGQPSMTAANDLIYNNGWYVFSIGTDYYTKDKAFSFILNSGSTETTTKTKTFWFDAEGISGAAGTYYDSDPTTVPAPVLPTVAITPSSGKKLPINGSISISLTNGNDTISSASVIVSGAVSKTYSYSDFKNNSLTVTAKELAISEGQTITVTATVTNSVGQANDKSVLTVAAENKDTFTWDNANVYFVLTDRFYNGDTKNDHSYYRNKSNISNTVATFHGGDIAGLTQKLDYFEKLGVNAIWITAPYEQAHGWVGGKNGAFPHYAFHGYYTLDWTYMDQNMGTVEELRTFVNACHSKGIRVVMDVVMNHVGYNNTEDMITYNFGYTDHKEHGWLSQTDGKWEANDTVKWDNSYWDSTWFGPFIRSFGYNSGSEYGGSCGGLPDVKTELTSSVGMAPVLLTKWAKEKDDDTETVKAGGNTTGNKIGDYKNPSVSNVDWISGYSGDYRTDKNIAPADYQVVWLSAWVRELGIDGFRCDTAKHVEPFRWGQLKVACQAALEKWRADSTKSKLYNSVDTGAADWDESFWMTGECFGWTSTSGQGDYYTTGKFDSMINFSFNGAAGDGTSSSYPSENTWSSYLSINSNADSDGNGNRNNVLTYISSHDTKLCRTSNQYEVGTMLQLTPGGVQIYYGDETNRPRAYTDCGDTDMMTRGDMNWDSKTDLAAHWGKVGTFRKYNPAVGAGTGTAYKRTYTGAAGENKVAISLSSPTVDVSGLFADGTTVYNWYDGKSATVSGGNATFSGSSASTSKPVLVSDRNPADYGVSF